MGRTVHIFWYVELYMDRTVHIMSGIWVLYSPYGPYNIWNISNIWTPGSRVGGPGGESPPVSKKAKNELFAPTPTVTKECCAEVSL